MFKKQNLPTATFVNPGRSTSVKLTTGEKEGTKHVSESKSSIRMIIEMRRKEKKIAMTYRLGSRYRDEWALGIFAWTSLSLYQFHPEFPV